MVGFGGFLYHVLFFCDKQPDVSHVAVVELCVGIMMTLLVMSAAAVTTDKFKSLCDSLSDSPTCGSSCEDKLGCIADALSGFDGFYNRVVATQDSLWIATAVWCILAVHSAFMLQQKASGDSKPKHESFGV